MSAQNVPTNILSYGKMRDLLKSRGEKADFKALKAEYERNELTQIFHRPPVVRKNRFLKIIGEPRSFQCDIAFLPTMKRANGGIHMMLVLIDIPSRRGFAYPIRTASMTDVIQAMNLFKKSVGKIVRISGDNGFNNAAFRDWCERAGCDLKTDVAKDDHASGGGNKLGIVDRYCRTLKLYIRKWVVANDDPRWVEHLDEIVELYNTTPHAGIANKTPMQMWADEGEQVHNFLKDLRYNIKIKGNKHVKIGSAVRLYEPKQQFGKESYNYSRDLYTVTGQDGNRFLVQGPDGKQLRRRVKPHELLAVREAELRPIPKRGRVAFAEKNQKHITRVVREGLVDEPRATELVDNMALPQERPSRSRRAPAWHNDFEMDSPPSRPISPPPSAEPPALRRSGRTSRAPARLDL